MQTKIYRIFRILGCARICFTKVRWAMPIAIGSRPFRAASIFKNHYSPSHYSTSFRNSSSVRIFTVPSFFALSNFDPASAPTTK